MGLRLRDTRGFVFFMVFLAGCVFVSSAQISPAQAIIAAASILATAAFCVWCMVSKNE